MTRVPGLPVPVLLTVLVGIGAGAGWGCGGAGAYLVASAREVPASSGAPHLDAVIDVGDFALIPESGPLPAFTRDGRIGVGELVLLAGYNFGRQPTILVDGIPAGVLARTQDGGILVRIPAGVSSGTIRFEVSHPDGKTELSRSVSRLALAAVGSTVHVFREEGGIVTEGEPVAIPNAGHVRFSGDGALAYVTARAGQDSTVHVVSMAAASGPRVVQKTVSFAFDVVAMSVAERAPLLVVVGPEQLKLFSLREPWRPAAYPTVHMPAAFANHGPIVGADVSPDGKWLALAFAEHNRLALVDLGDPATPRPGATLDVLPGARVPLVRDLHFAREADVLWVLSGESAATRKEGHWPSQLVRVKVSATPYVVDASDVTDSVAPIAMVVVKNEEVPSGAAIHALNEDVTSYVTAMRWAAGADGPAPTGLLLLFNGHGGYPIATLAGIPGDADATPDSRLWLGTVCAGSGAGAMVSIVVVKLAQGEIAQSLPLESVTSCAAPFARFRLQP